MQATTARQTMTITFNPSNVFAQSLIETLRLSRQFKVEECPYDMRYVQMVRDAEKGESHRLTREELWQ